MAFSVCLMLALFLVIFKNLKINRFDQCYTVGLTVQIKYYLVAEHCGFRDAVKIRARNFLVVVTQRHNFEAKNCTLRSFSPQQMGFNLLSPLYKGFR